MSRLLLYLIFLTIFLEPAYSKIINVPSQFSTIQSAIEASMDGDTILVAKGTYKENINLKGKKIFLTSDYLFDKNVNTILNTIIDGGNPTDPKFASCVMMVSGEDSNTVLQGFTLTNGKGSVWVDEHGAGTYREGGGILVTLSSPVIRFNYIVGNEAVNKTGVNSAGGGGIRVGDGNPKILNNVIAHNKGFYGAGIVFNYTGGVIKNNIITQNEGGQDFGGGGIWIFNLSNENHKTVVENNTIVGNISYLNGGGIRIWNTAMTGKNNIIWGNSGLSAGKANIDLSGSTAVLSYNCVQGGWTGIGNISSNPLFESGDNLYLAANSPCLDAGDPASLNDQEDTAKPGNPKYPAQGTLRNDMGAYGGPFAELLPPINFNTKLFFSYPIISFKQTTVGDSTTSGIDVHNSSQTTAEIDSMLISGNNGITILHYPQTIEAWSTDSILVKWIPSRSGAFIDTLKIYHNDTTQANPFIVKLSGRAKIPVDVSEVINLPSQYTLEQNYPNPFNPSTTLSFGIPEAGEVTLTIYNLIGEEVVTLINRYMPAGKYQIPFTAYDIPSGVYYYRLNVKQFSDVKKLVLMK